LHRTYHRHRNRFGHTRWDSYITRLKWKVGIVHLDIVLLLMRDWCTVRVERTIGSEIVLEAPDGTPRLRGSCGISLRSILRQC
jgi:hypothetical protein